jgi:arylsulfatase A-like enzyme
MLPTFAKLAGVEVPQDRTIDGRDITSLMFDPKAGPVRDTHFYFGGNSELQAIRQGDWKLFLTATTVPSDAAGGKRKKGRNVAAGLYNLASDPGEANDVATANPEVVAKLLPAARKFNVELLKNKRPAGQAK